MFIEKEPRIDVIDAIEMESVLSVVRGSGQAFDSCPKENSGDEPLCSEKEHYKLTCFKIVPGCLPSR